jgi:ribosome assembly protein RRB1
MSKRAAATDTGVIEGQSWRKARPSSKDGLGSSKRPSLPPDINEEMGEFEDEWEDEMESDDEVVDRTAEKLDGGSIFLPEALDHDFSNTINYTGRS